MKSDAEILYEDKTHRCYRFQVGEELEADRHLPSSQYLIVHNDEAVLLEPGGQSIAPGVMDRVMERTSLEKIGHIFYSHQDPDVLSSILDWTTLTPAVIHLSALWERFVSHLGVLDSQKLRPIPDHGGKLDLGTGDALYFIPAHFLHSPGNFSLYDSRSKILFSGDIGASIFPLGKGYDRVERFEQHLPFCEGFHRRYMAGNAACRAWVERVRRFNVEMIVPHHGAYYPKEAVEPFLDWLENLECGIDRIPAIYGE